MSKVDLSVQIGKLKLANPVMPASGTFGEETSNFIDLNRLGAIVPKSITLNPRQGNKPPRVVETASGLINAVGIQNKGVHDFIENVLPFYEKYTSPIIVSVSAYSSEEFIKMVELLNPHDSVSALELNISCPNLAAGGKSFGMSCEDTYGIVKSVREHTDKVIIPKLTPNVNDIASIALSAEEAGADGISLTNTYTAMAIDIHTRRPKLGNVIGGLSGPAIKPISLRMVWQVAQKVRIPVIGLGGISTWEDAVEFLLAGASAIQVGTYNFPNPHAMIEVIDGIEKYMLKNKMSSLEDLVGKVVID